MAYRWVELHQQDQVKTHLVPRSRYCLTKRLPACTRFSIRAILMLSHSRRCRACASEVLRSHTAIYSQPAHFATHP